MKVNWENYDTSYLVNLAEEQIPNEKAIIEDLKNIELCFKRSNKYYYFIYSPNPNEENSVWKFDRTIELKSKEKGNLILDILKDSKVGGIEFLT